VPVRIHFQIGHIVYFAYVFIMVVSYGGGRSEKFEVLDDDDDDDDDDVILKFSQAII